MKHPVLRVCVQVNRPRLALNGAVIVRPYFRHRVLVHPDAVGGFEGGPSLIVGTCDLVPVVIGPTSRFRGPHTRTRTPAHLHLRSLIRVTKSMEIDSRMVPAGVRTRRERHERSFDQSPQLCNARPDTRFTQGWSPGPVPPPVRPYAMINATITAMVVISLAVHLLPAGWSSTSASQSIRACGSLCVPRGSCRGVGSFLLSSCSSVVLIRRGADIHVGAHKGRGSAGEARASESQNLGTAPFQ